MNVTKKSVTKLISDAIARNQHDLNEHLTICEMLRPLIGKEINKRTLNPKRLCDFEYKERYSSIYIHLKGAEYGHCISSKDGLIDIDAFHESDTCNYKGASERLEKLKSLDITQLVKTFGKAEKTFNELRFIFGDIDQQKIGSFENPAYYELINLVQSDVDKKDIEVHKMHWNRKNRIVERKTCKNIPEIIKALS